MSRRPRRPARPLAELLDMTSRPAAPAGPTTWEAVILAGLPATAQELAGAVNLPGPDVERVLRGLEARGRVRLEGGTWRAA